MAKLFVLTSTIDDRITNLKNIIQEPDENIVYVVSHQLSKALKEDAKKYIESMDERKDVLYSSLTGKGVAKNRNNTFRFLEPGSICLILDDDIFLCADAFSIVRKTFDKNPAASFISFKILNTNGGDYKPYPREKRWHSLSTLTSIGTTEMAFESDLILKKNIRFDERFGPGAPEYPLGEDYIFAMDLYRMKTKMLFVPIPIVMHPPGSTGGSLDKKIIYARGAVFARVFGPLSYLIDIYFSLKKRRYYHSRYSIYDYIKLMILGSLDFRREKK